VEFLFQQDLGQEQTPARGSSKPRGLIKINAKLFLLLSKWRACFGSYPDKEAKWVRLYGCLEMAILQATLI
jgi:hypothetical protein